MTITEAVELLNQIGADVDFALDYLQEQKFQLALYIGGQLIFDEVPIFKAAVDLLIERGRTDLLERRCPKIYESACVAEPLLKQAIPNCKKMGMMIGEAEAKGNIWASHIKAYWEKVVLPILQTDPQTQAETTPQKRGDKPQQVPSWATTDVAKRAFAKAVELGYMSPLEYGYSWKLKSKALLAYFVECLSKTDMLTPYPDTEACAYFHATCLRQRRQSYLSNIQGGRPKDFDKIDALFE